MQISRELRRIPQNIKLQISRLLSLLNTDENVLAFYELQSNRVTEEDFIVSCFEVPLSGFELQLDPPHSRCENEKKNLVEN